MTKIELHPFTTDRFQQLISWIPDEEFMIQFSGNTLFSYPLTESQLLAYVKDQNKHIFSIKEKQTDTIIGHGEVFLKSSKTAMICRILIGDPKFRNKGLGKEMITMLSNYAFETLNVYKLSLNVYEWNTSAIMCYQKSGFKINIKKSKTITVNDKTWKVINMVLLKSHWINEQKNILNVTK